MQYDDDSIADSSDAADADVTTTEERLQALRSPRNAAGYSPQARQRIEYLQELRRLRSLVGDDRLDTF